MYIEEIVKDIKLEDNNLEYKSKLNRDDIVSWLKTIAGFSNAEGGTLYIGIEDKTHKLIGFDRKEVDEERNYFNNQINDHITPRPNLKISFIRYEINKKERFIIKIFVDESNVKPVILKYKGVPSIYIRREGFTNGATYEEITNMAIKNNKKQYDVLLSDIKYDEAKLSTLKTFYKNHNNGKELKEKALKSLGFMNKDNFLANGATLFLDDYNGSNTEIILSVFAGFNKGSERIVSINRFKGNIVDSINFVMNFIKQRMNHSILKLNDSRINVDSYPIRALFEGVINSIVHRDYYLDGTQIQIDMFKDRLEITSPGSFYQGEKISKTYNLSNLISKRRNELIAGVFVLCNVMEAAGTGFDKIAEDYAFSDIAHKPYIYSSSDHFTLVLPDLTYENGVENAILPILIYSPIPKGTNYDHMVLSFCYAKARKISEITSFLKISDSTYFRNKVIKNLVQHKYLTKDKVMNTTFYKTNNKMVEVE